MNTRIIQQELRAQRARERMLVVWVCLVLGTVIAAMVTGLYLKAERKVTVAGAVHAGCYRWSDGTVTCQHGWRKLTDDMVYGCTWANADPATGECK